MKKTKELMNELDVSERRAASLKKIESEFHYIFWESNYNPITMHVDDKVEGMGINTNKVEQYLTR